MRRATGRCAAAAPVTGQTLAVCTHAAQIKVRPSLLSGRINVPRCVGGDGFVAVSEDVSHHGHH